MSIISRDKSSGIDVCSLITQFVLKFSHALYHISDPKLPFALKSNCNQITMSVIIGIVCHLFCLYLFIFLLNGMSG